MLFRNAETREKVVLVVDRIILAVCLLVICFSIIGSGAEYMTYLGTLFYIGIILFFIYPLLLVILTIATIYLLIRINAENRTRTLVLAVGTAAVVLASSLLLFSLSTGSPANGTFVLSVVCVAIILSNYVYARLY